MLILFGWLAFLGFTAAFAITAVLLNLTLRRGGKRVLLVLALCFGLGAGAIVVGVSLGAAAGWSSIALGALITIFSLWHIKSARRKPR
jgi:hypothetical protein